MVRCVLHYFVLILFLATLAACGSSESATPPNQQVAKSTATLKMSLTGTLQAGTGISGAEFTLNIPANVTPKNTNGIIDSDVVVPSGVFADSTLSPQVVYSAATSTLKVILPSSASSGVTQVGEVATVTLLLTGNSTPLTSSFSVSTAGVFDVATYSSINGLGVAVSSVTLQ